MGERTMKKSIMAIPLVIIAVIVMLFVFGTDKHEKPQIADLNSLFSRQATFEEQKIEINFMAQLVDDWNCGKYESQEECQNNTYMYFTASNTEKYEIKETLNKMGKTELSQLCTNNDDCPGTQRCITLCSFNDGQHVVKEIVCAFDRVDNQVLFALSKIGVCDEFNTGKIRQ